MSNPFTASNAIVAQYADTILEYNADHQVTKQTSDAGALNCEYAYTESSFDDDVTYWKYKQVTTHGSGKKDIVYANYLGQPILKATEVGTSQWLRFNGQIVVFARDNVNQELKSFSLPYE